VEVDPAQPGGLSVWLSGKSLGVAGSAADIAEWVELEVATRPGLEQFGARLVRWLEDFLHMGGGEADPSVSRDRAREDMTLDTEAVDVGLARLPTPAELGAKIGCAVDGLRALTVLTWGDALTSRAAVQAQGSEYDQNAKPLNGRGGGANTRYNALEDRRILRNVVSSLAEGGGALLLERLVPPPPTPPPTAASHHTLPTQHNYTLSTISSTRLLTNPSLGPLLLRHHRATAGGEDRD
jgi:hypothetical protein